MFSIFNICYKVIVIHFNVGNEENIFICVLNLICDIMYIFIVYLKCSF